jgi:predicted acetyltransferase
MRLVVNYQHLQTADIDDLGSLVSESFNAPDDIARPWIERSGVPNWRVVKDSTSLLGGLMVIPMGQWFGGRAVPMTGLAGVVVSPRARGRGVGKRLIGQTLEEIRDSGVALSALYASTTSFYRHCGYERAGAAYQVELNLKELTARSGPLEVRTLEAEDSERVEALQHDWVQDHACLKRGPYLWHRVRNPKGQAAEQFGFFSGDRLEGYVLWKRSEHKGLDNELQITDLVLTTPAAQESFWGYLAGHRAFFSKAQWLCPSSSPWLLALDEPWNYKMSMHEHWMLRLVDLQKAFTERGYPAGPPCEIHFEVEDPLLSNNNGRWLLRVGECEGRLTTGGEGLIKTDIGALASLYSGFLSATQLSVTGRLEGPVEQLALADGTFRGEPRLCDFF